MELLKEWAEILNGREYREELFLDEEKKLKEVGIVVVFGASDDLCELRGAIDDELDCWNGRKMVYVKEVDRFVGEDYYEENSEELIQVDLSKRPFINAIYTKVGWQYELPAINQEEFIILEDKEQYCLGKIFYKKDFINWIEKDELKTEYPFFDNRFSKKD